jgi:hypothetical protein
MLFLIFFFHNYMYSRQTIIGEFPARQFLD